MRMRKRAARGFTLVEVMVSGALLTVILGGAMVVVVGVNGASERVRRVGDAQETARIALDGLAEEIRQAGAGALSGQIGVAPAGSGTRRIPTIYSGPDVVVMGPNNVTTIVTNSIYIISADPTAGVPTSDAKFMLGDVSAAVQGQPIQIVCSSPLDPVPPGPQTDCSSTAVKYGGGTLLLSSGGVFQPLIVGDYVEAVYLRPTALGAVAGGSQTLTFAEQLAGAFSPSAKAPFGFAQGAYISRARVSHWYLKQIPGNNDYELVRSHPLLTTNALGGGCLPSDAPFVDETTAGGPGVPVGTIVGSGPVESLQFRYIVDDQVKDDSQAFSIWNGLPGTPTPAKNATDLNHFTVCDTAEILKLREVRIQIVARASQPDHAQNATSRVNRYSTPAFEGVAPSDNGTDAYPRRSFETRVVPRNLQGVRI